MYVWPLTLVGLSHKSLVLGRDRGQWNVAIVLFFMENKTIHTVLPI